MEWKIIQAAVALAAYTGVLWWFFFGPRARATATLSASGAQELSVTVQGGYSPDRLVAKRGIPLRIKFTRKESSSCSERVVFGDFDISKALPENETTVVEFTPDRTGEFTFTCGMGMYQGRLVVQDGDAPVAAEGAEGHSHAGHNHSQHGHGSHSSGGHQHHMAHDHTRHDHTGHNHGGKQSGKEEGACH